MCVMYVHTWGKGGREVAPFFFNYTHMALALAYWQSVNKPKETNLERHTLLVPLLFLVR
jgi:hypothetical protein